MRLWRLGGLIVLWLFYNTCTANTALRATTLSADSQGSQVANPNDAQSEAEPFLSLLRELETTVRTVDTARWVGFFTEDAIVMPPTSAPVRGRDAIAALYRPAFSGYASLDVRYELIELRHEGNLATIHYSGRATLVRENGDSYQTNTHYIDVLERQEDGRWLISLHAWSRY